MNQKGFSPLYIIIVSIVVSVITLFTPIPYYHGEVVCKPGQINCSKPGWRLGPSLWEKLYPSRLTSNTVQVVPSSNTPSQPTPSQKPCMTDAMICPDGTTSVGRKGPNCEFESCPTESISWKKFSAQGFSFRYPSEYIVREPVNSFFSISPNESIPPQYADITIDARLINSLSNYETAVSKAQEGLINKTVNEYRGGVRITGVIEEGIGGGRYIDATIFKYKTGALKIEYVNANISKEIYNKILATFTLD